MINSKVTQVKTYVGVDGLIHFTDSAGADTALNFSKGITSIRCYSKRVSINSYGDIKYTTYIVIDGVTTTLGGISVPSNNPYGLGSTFDKTFT